jgi:hypothetical protein
MLFGVMVGLFTQHVVMPNDISLNVIMLSMLSFILAECHCNEDNMPGVILLKVIMLRVIMLSVVLCVASVSVIILHIIMLSVIKTECRCTDVCYAMCHSA